MSLNAASRCIVLVACLLSTTSAHALCTLVCSCSASTTSVVFAAHNPLSASNNDSTGKVTVSCGGVAGLAIPYTVALGAGVNGTMAARKMASGAARLNYNLYTTSGYATVFGDGSGSTATVGGNFLLNVLGTAPAQDIIVYARIPGSQTSVAPGSYTDTLVVTLTYF